VAINLHAIEKLTAPLKRRVRNLVRRAIVRLVYDDPKMQELQIAVLSGEVRDQVERWEDYGLTSHPIPGAEALVLALGGNSAHSAVIKVGDRRYRLTSLAEGEVALYDDQGQKIHLKRGKEIEITGCDTLTATVGVVTTLTSPVLTATCAASATVVCPQITLGDAARANVRQLIDERFKALFDAHTHSGVATGGGTSGPPTSAVDLAAHATDKTRAS
jgi:phage baseplate assembly protein V